ncbi:MAG TPA: hypothetical protein VMT16_14435 [Thermoanaerobaculia bacterium]|nr:hypothetical protein [Thermoanaerobaculia bacterium]
MTRRWLSLTLLALLLLAAGVLAARAGRRWAGYRQAEGVCQAATAGRWDEALRRSQTLPVPRVSRLRAADCRCIALMSTGRREACVELLERLLAEPATGDWLPNPLLTAVLVEDRRDRGQVARAAQLAHQGALHYPDSGPLLVLETELRLRLEEPDGVLADVERRLERGPPLAPVVRLHVARRYLGEHDAAGTLRLLGEEPPAPEVRDIWASLRAQALALQGRPEELLALVEQWSAWRGDPALPQAYYAVLLSVQQLEDPAGRPVEALLQQVVERGDRLADEELLEGAYVRLVGALTVLGRSEEALAWFDRGAARFDGLGHLERDDLLRSATHHSLGLDNLIRVQGAVAIRLPRPRPGDVLLLSPDPSQPPDTAYEAHPVPAEGVVRVRRALGTWPQRWVLRQGDGTVAASGAVWPNPQREVTVEVARRPGVAPRQLPPWRPPPAGDGRRAVVVILDCGDWRFVQYGRARGELPTLGRLQDRGRSAVLLSEPPFTAIAIRSLAKPGAQGIDGFLGLIHRLGAEVEGLDFVGRNPFAPLAWVLPAHTDLFETLGAGALKTVNMLHAHGSMEEVGRHGRVVGPRGAEGLLEGLRSRRSLTADEMRDLDEADPAMLSLVEQIAADFDAIERLAGERSFDLIVLRVAALDLLTHGGFPAATAARQDDGRGLLFALYRYLDRRIGELQQRLAGDDLLVVLSDHGIRTALEHAPEALFLAIGPGVEPGRVAGAPELRGVGRMLADYFGVPTEWPRTLRLREEQAAGGSPSPAGPSGSP